MSEGGTTLVMFAFGTSSTLPLAAFALHILGFFETFFVTHLAFALGLDLAT